MLPLAGCRWLTFIPHFSTHLIASGLYLLLSPHPLI
jgi:hypothetical protein